MNDLNLTQADNDLEAAKRRAKALAADMDDAAMRLDDSRWRASQSALERVHKQIEQLEGRRASIMAGEPPEPAQDGAMTDREKRLAKQIMLQVFLALKREREETQKEIEQAVADIGATLKVMKGLQPLAYLGPWRPDAEYLRGNFVSWNGAMWHADDPKKGARPGDGPGWTLAVKAGKDAK